MPYVSVITDIEALAAKKAEVCTMVHNAVKSVLGKPDQYITVSFCKVDMLMVAGKDQAVAVQVDSIGGNFNNLIGTICEGLAAMGVDKSQVTGTFRSVTMQEFGMHGKALGA
mmetsp:Transcript_33181/g.60108  ORF Transcript_33181/g.60108 Transcript_33181/m.60108 type:complete len:112 (-) Transcript_33181:120-455(-)|eukprot:CAMPEP_0197663342 /NCGR_PEP_ID=MMETSP1338-20131121/57065_1 /TAXON_ID=43686 ORGANISM="Pelagodinium beii, Strain RCC1491" /NCGR_SAMPLE_ID=MMETSP1338 /ASSEMBLY_ACC=CAM_ASM_000754 /LENGTH=111 /DNA_ID=CAMNT_0043241657 /DNA_START=61 /DNA_END=399 /DNA_ORIENTATION=-